MTSARRRHDRRRPPPTGSADRRAARAACRCATRAAASTLTVTGLVRNPRRGAAANRVSPSSSAFDRHGDFVASGRAPLDFLALEPGDESPFLVTIPNVGDVGRYRVSFRTDAGVGPSRRSPRRPGALTRATLSQASMRIAASPSPARRPSPPLVVIAARRSRGDGQRAGRLPLQERRRADQRHGHRHRRRRPLRVRDCARRTSPSSRTARRRTITHFSNERVPVSLGIALDTSGSMTPEKMSAARAAIDRFIFDLLGQGRRAVLRRVRRRAPTLVQAWTTDRRADQPRRRAASSPRRHGHVRRHRRRRCPTRRAGQEPQEGAAGHLRRQRHQQHARRSASCGR